MRKLIWLGVFVALLAACGAPPASSTPAPQIPLPTAAPTQASNTPAVDLSAELNALKAGDTATAITGLEQILANAPASSEAFVLGWTGYYRAGSKDKAEDQFLAAFRTESGCGPAAGIARCRRMVEGG
jgi:Tfp pilus assembly protein PilF